MTTTQTALTSKLSEPAADSKKYQMVLNGLLGVALVFVATSIVLLFKPDAMDSITKLAERAMTIIGALCGLYTGAQFGNDWKTTDALSKQPTQALE